MSTLEKVSFLSDKLDQLEIAEATAKRAWGPPKSFYASSYMDCARKQVYALQGVPESDPETVNPDWKRDARYGDAIAGAIQKQMAANSMLSMLPDFSKESAIRDDRRSKGLLSPAMEIPLADYTLSPEAASEFVTFNIAGRIDGILTGYGGKQLVLEIKTLAGRYYRPDKKQDYFNKLYHYEAQTQLYQYFWRCKTAFILVVNRAESHTESYMTTINPALFQRELYRVEAANKTFQAGQLPEPEPNRGPCRFCNWRSLCPATEKEKNSGGYKHV